MRVFIALLLSAAAFCMLSFSAHAAVKVVDECDKPSSSYAKYTNLGPAPPNPLAQFQPDTSYLTVQNHAEPGSVEYTIQGAETIRVEIYSQLGTFASLRMDGIYTIGLQEASMSSQNKLRTRYCEEKKSVFLHLGGQSKLLNKKAAPFNYYFFEDFNCPHNHHEYMGVNIYTSVDGKKFFPLPAPPALTNVVVYENTYGTISYYYEQYDASLPAGAKYIKVVLRDFSQYAMGETMKPLNTAYSRLHLARVSFSGANVQEGEQSAPSSSAPEASSSGSEQTTGGGTSNNNTSSKKKEKSSSSSSSSKPSSSSNSSSSSKAASADKGSSGSLSESRSPSAPPERFDPFEEEAIPAMATVQVAAPAPREKTDWKTTAMAVVYTISAVGIIGRLIYKLF